MESISSIFEFLINALKQEPIAVGLLAFLIPTFLNHQLAKQQKLFESHISHRTMLMTKRTEILSQLFVKFSAMHMAIQAWFSDEKNQSKQEDFTKSISGLVTYLHENRVWLPSWLAKELDYLLTCHLIPSKNRPRYGDFRHSGMQDQDYENAISKWALRERAQTSEDLMRTLCQYIEGGSLRHAELRLRAMWHQTKCGQIYFLRRGR